MVNTLYILRHGIAVPHGSPDYPDAERPLTAEGRTRVQQIGSGFNYLRLDLDRILASPLPRALDTAQLFAQALGREQDVEEAAELSADRSATQIATWLESRTESHLMIVGHNPSLSDLVSLLTVGQVVDGFCELRRGGLATLVARTQGRYAIDWITRPRLLRRIGA